MCSRPRVSVIAHGAAAQLRLASAQRPKRPWIENSGVQRPIPDAILLAMDYRKLITLEPGKRGGKPCIRGMRITVYDVLGWLASGMSEEEILHDFPDLTRDDIKACLAFAADRERRTTSIVA